MLGGCRSGRFLLRVPVTDHERTTSRGKTVIFSGTQGLEKSALFTASLALSSNLSFNPPRGASVEYIVEVGFGEASPGAGGFRYVIDSVRNIVKVGARAGRRERAERRGKHGAYLDTLLFMMRRNPRMNFEPDAIVYDAENVAEVSAKRVRAGLLWSEPEDVCGTCTLLGFSELGPYALMSGYDRIGTSTKFMVAQTALWRQIYSAFIEGIAENAAAANNLRNLLPNLNPYTSRAVGGDKAEDIAKGDLLLALIGLIKDYLLALKYGDKLGSVLTTAVWAFRGSVETRIGQASEIVIGYFTSKYRGREKSDCEAPCVMDPLDRVYGLLATHYMCRDCLGSDVLGRLLRARFNSLKKFRGRVKRVVSTAADVKNSCVVIEWSEQMGPVDVGLITLFIHGIIGGADASVKPDKLIILATPLSLTNAFIGYAYATKIMGGDKLWMMLTSGSDPAVVRAAAEDILGRKCRGERILYFSGGSTYDTLAMTYYLRSRVADENKLAIVPPSVIV